MSQRGLHLLAATIWHVGCLALFWKGAVLLAEAEALEPGRPWPWLAVPAAMLIGFLKARFLLLRAARHNITRIASLARPRPWQVYRPGFLLFLLVNVALAKVVIEYSRGHYVLTILCGTMLLAIGFALLGSSFVWWRRPARIR